MTQYAHILKNVTPSGDMLIERNQVPYILTKGAEQFKLAFPASSLDDMDAFEAFCLQEEKSMKLFSYRITIRRLEGPLCGSTIFPTVFTNFESAHEFMIDIGKTLDGAVNKFHITLTFSDGLEATDYTSLGELTLFDEEDPFELRKFWTEEMEWIRKHSWFEKEKIGLAQILERLPWIDIVNESRKPRVPKETAMLVASTTTTVR